MNHRAQFHPPRMSPRPRKFSSRAPPGLPQPHPNIPPHLLTQRPLHPHPLGPAASYRASWAICSPSQPANPGPPRLPQKMRCRSRTAHLTLSRWRSPSRILTCQPPMASIRCKLITQRVRTYPRSCQQADFPSTLLVLTLSILPLPRKSHLATVCISTRTLTSTKVESCPVYVSPSISIALSCTEYFASRRRR